MNCSPMISRFSVGVGDAREGLEEPILGVDDPQRLHVVEGLADLVGLALAHQAGIDVDRGQSVADGLVG